MWSFIGRKCPKKANPWRQRADERLPGAWHRRQWGETTDPYWLTFGSEVYVLKVNCDDFTTIDTLKNQ